MKEDAGKQVRLLHGDCVELMKAMPDCSVDSIVTDPPYELGFMGKKWDGAGIAYSVEMWSEALRVLKPGGHLLAFGGTRTYHRMACAIEDAGFEIRDSIHWVYGSGFPKSLDVSKAIDKQRYDRADIYRVTAWVKQARDAAGISNSDIDAAFGFVGMAGHWTSNKQQPRVPTLDQVPTLLDVLGVKAKEVPDDIRRLLWNLNGKKGQPGENWAKRKVVGTKRYVNGGGTSYELRMGERVEVDSDVTLAATVEARRWEGWGTALKPAHEPIVVARKPLAGTVAANVLKHGTGALNIDGARVGGTDGRWPANVIFDTEAGALLDEQADGASRFFTCADYDKADVVPFIYQAKPSKAERNAGTDTNTHPTVKPVALMRHLVRLVTPPGGTVLDPFAGSGTTLVAAVLEGFDAVGCEMTEEYLPIIEGRIAWAKTETTKDQQLTLHDPGQQQ